ncbi:CsxC family protein [Tissierella pigra]|uniref:DUF3794 domain-containing protein n=1 Tax=Tissierella pigra TaxID=2607614 RepID=A0A6N7XIP0_9FIRM|nr:hypothetical protein [Tissierella pigra]MSU01496.1 hypothetical protein [Tissierella pigra]
MYRSVEGTNISNVRVFDNTHGKTKCNYNPSISECSSNSKYPHSCVEVKTNMLDSCTNTPITPVGITTGVIAKIPVVLAELTVQFHLSSLIKLPELALDVKNIKKKVKITQCLLLQPTNILFIKGFIRKNIDYTTGNCANMEGICGELHHCIIDVPFECSTPLTFYTPPEELAVNSSTEFEYFKVSNLPDKHFAEKDKLLSGDLSEFNQIIIENFNELPFCELINARIFEFDEFIGRHRPCGAEFPIEEKFFNRIEEKMVIEFTVKVLQNRQVQIPAVTDTSGGCHPKFPCSANKD